MKPAAVLVAALEVEIGLLLYPLPVFKDRRVGDA